MEKYIKTKTVLLTGAGGPAPPGMIDCLRKYGYRIIAVDMLEHSPAFYLSDAAYVVPAGNDPKFLSKMVQICSKEKVDAVISVVDEELEPCHELEQYGIKVIQPELSFIRKCLNKYDLMKDLHRYNIKAPKTWKIKDIPIKTRYPLLIKPNIGRGSRGIGKVNNLNDLKQFIDKSNYRSNELIAQEFIEGQEYTVSVVCWRDGIVKAIVPKEIISKIGVTRIAVTRKNKKIEKICKDIQKKFKANGPFNVQLIIDKETLEPYPFEINPRFSTSITLTLAAGIDELGGLVTQALYGEKSFNFPKNWKEGVVLIRRTLDTFVDEKTFIKYPLQICND